MTEDTVLAQLRGIHLPADPGLVAPSTFALWPFVLLAAVVGAILVVRIWRGSQWRRAARAEMARILEVDDQSTQWSMLLAFSASLSERARRPVTLPPLAYRRPDTVSQGERNEFITFLSRELGR